MANYSIFETENFEKELNKLQKKDLFFIKKKLSEYVYPQIRNEPHYGVNIKKLRDWEPETWRYRIGKYRLFFEIYEDDMLALITSIDLRKDAYK